MEKYNYYEAIKADIKNYIDNEEIKASDYADIDEIKDKLYDELWMSDSVTGNGSGSYTCSAYEAEENLCHNWELLEEACDEFCCDTDEAFKKGAEHWDVTIRCYLLSPVLSDVVEELFGSEFEDREEDGE
jgi:hypothetical protein